MHIQIKDGLPLKWPMAEFDVRALFPANVSQPNIFSDELAEQVSCYPFAEIGKPYHDPITQTLREGDPNLIDGVWTQQWVVEDIMDTSIIEANQEAARIAAIPVSVSPRQIRQALTRASLRTAVESAVAAGDQDLKDWWEFATEFQRTNQHVVDMAAALGVTERQLDDLWTLAGSL